MASTTDIEMGRRRDLTRLEGFPTLAHFISQDNDGEIYRRFNRLGARNLLYLQSNVIRLEKKLDDLDRNEYKNAAGNPEIRRAARGLLPSEDTEQDTTERVKLQDQIAIALRNYREALIQEQYFFGRQGDDPVLLGDNASLLDDERDLVALAPVDDDRLGSFLRDRFGRFCVDRRRSSQSGLDIFYFSDSRIHFAGNVISTIFCAILLLGAMAVLSVLDRQSWKIRLGMVALFTSLFAFTVGLLTNARRAEIFGSTAAYAAVLVVYVSQGLGPSNDVPKTG